MLKFMCKPAEKMSDIEMKKAVYKLHIISILSTFVIILFMSLYAYINNYLGVSGIILYLMLTIEIVSTFKNMMSIKAHKRCELESSLSTLKKVAFALFILSVIFIGEVILRY